MVDKYVGPQNDPMSWLTLDLTTLGTDTIYITMSHIDSIPVGTKTPDPTPLTLPTDLPVDPDPYPSLSDLLKKYNSSNDINSWKSKKKKRDNEKNHQKDKKDDSSDPA